MTPIAFVAPVLVAGVHRARIYEVAFVPAKRGLELLHLPTATVVSRVLLRLSPLPLGWHARRLTLFYTVVLVALAVATAWWG